MLLTQVLLLLSNKYTTNKGETYSFSKLFQREKNIHEVKNKGGNMLHIPLIGINITVLLNLVSKSPYDYI